MKKSKNNQISLFITLIAVILFTLSGCSELALFESGSHDRALIGKWKSRRGSTVELNSDGSGYTSVMNTKDDLLMFSKYFPTLKHTAGDPTWSSEGGQLTFTVEHTESVEIKLKDGYVLIGGSGDGRDMLRKKGTVDTDSYIGTWCLDRWEITLNDDGTGSLIRPEFSFFGIVNERVDAYIEWRIEETPRAVGAITWTEERLCIDYTMLTTFDYYIDGDTLTLFTSDASEEFVKIN